MRSALPFSWNVKPFILLSNILFSQLYVHMYVKLLNWWWEIHMIVLTYINFVPNEKLWLKRSMFIFCWFLGVTCIILLVIKTFLLKSRISVTCCLRSIRKLWESTNHTICVQHWPIIQKPVKHFYTSKESE